MSASAITIPAATTTPIIPNRRKMNGLVIVAFKQEDI